jgi:CRISPR-associated protein Cas1
VTALFLTEPGSSLVRRGDQLVVWKDGAAQVALPVAQVDHVVVAGGGIQVTTAALNWLAGRGIDVAYLTRGGKLLGRFSAPQRRDAGRRLAQYRALTNARTRLSLARAFVVGKIVNQASLVERRGQVDAAKRLALMAAEVGRAPSLESLRGIEGAASRVYFGLWNEILPRGLAFAGRHYYPPPDPLNAALGLAYTLLLKDTLLAVEAAGLDASLGFLHELAPARPALALDLMEEFRPLVADSLVLELAHREVLSPGRHSDDRGILLSEKASRRLFGLYETRGGAW